MAIYWIYDFGVDFWVVINGDFRLYLLKLFCRSIGDNLSCGELLKGEVLGSSKAKRINNLPVDVEAIPPTVKD